MKKILLLFIICFNLVVLTGCGQIEDTNGEDDFSLVTITDENILKGYSSSSKMGSFYTETTINGVTKYKIKVSKFSGVEDVYERMLSDSYKLSLKCTLSSGNMKLVLIKDGEIFADILTAKEVSKELTLSPGEYQLRVAGESAKYELEISLSKK